MSKEELELDLHRVHSVLNISDVAIEAYHLSICDFFHDRKRAGKHYIHPVRVTLVRLPQNICRFVARNWGVVYFAIMVAIITAVCATLAMFGRR